jgi:hypothetical protein
MGTMTPSDLNGQDSGEQRAMPAYAWDMMRR